MKLRAGKAEYVFGGKKAMSDTLADSSRKRLIATYGAPEEFSWQQLRRTCGTYLTNSPAIFGAASVFMSARQLGHSVQVAEKHYLGNLRGISRDARTLEEAMQITEVMKRMAAGTGGKEAKSTSADAPVIADLTLRQVESRVSR